MPMVSIFSLFPVSFCVSFYLLFFLRSFSFTVLPIATEMHSAQEVRVSLFSGMCDGGGVYVELVFF